MRLERWEPQHLSFESEKVTQLPRQSNASRPSSGAVQSVQSYASKGRQGLAHWIFLNLGHLRPPSISFILNGKFRQVPMKNADWWWMSDIPVLLRFFWPNPAGDLSIDIKRCRSAPNGGTATSGVPPRIRFSQVSEVSSLVNFLNDEKGGSQTSEVSFFMKKWAIQQSLCHEHPLGNQRSSMIQDVAAAFQFKMTEFVLGWRLLQGITPPGRPEANRAPPEQRAKSWLLLTSFSHWIFVLNWFWP